MSIILTAEVILEKFAPDYPDRASWINFIGQDTHKYKILSITRNEIESKTKNFLMVSKFVRLKTLI